MNEKLGGNFYAPDGRTRWQRLLSRMFPTKAAPYMEDVDGFAPGCMRTVVVAHLDWRDRIRTLISGKVVVVTNSRTDVTVNKAQSESVVWVEAP